MDCPGTPNSNDEGELPADLREVLANRTVLCTVFGDFRYLDDHDLLPSTVLEAVDE